MAANVNEVYGEVGEATVDERIDAGRRFAKEASEKIPGYSFRLKTSPSTKKPGEVFVTVYVNGKGGTKPGRIGFGKFATPMLFPENETDAEAFVNAADAVGIKLKANFPAAE